MLGFGITCPGSGKASRTAMTLWRLATHSGLWDWAFRDCFSIVDSLFFFIASCALFWPLGTFGSRCFCFSHSLGFSELSRLGNTYLLCAFYIIIDSAHNERIRLYTYSSLRRRCFVFWWDRSSTYIGRYFKFFLRVVVGTHISSMVDDVGKDIEGMGDKEGFGDFLHLNPFIRIV